METSFPFTPLEWEKHLTATVQVAIPFGIFGILKMFPSIVVDTFKPFQTFLVACQPVTLLK